MLYRFSSSLAAFLSRSSKLLAQELKHCSTMSEISHLYEIVLHRLCAALNHKPTCLFLPLTKPLSHYPNVSTTELSRNWKFHHKISAETTAGKKNLSQFSHQATSVQGHFAICMTPKLMLREDGVFVRDVSRVWLKTATRTNWKVSGHFQVLQNMWPC